jgi:hypothetical protein
MTTKLSEASGVFLLELVFTGRTPNKGELKPAHRTPLVNAGLIAIEKQGRKDVIAATDAAWDWVAANLDLTLSKTRPTRALSAVLARLREFLASQDLPLADFVRSAPSARGAATGSPPGIASPASHAGPVASPDPLDQQIRRAYLAHTGGAFHTRMRLTALRSALADTERPVLDAELRRLASLGRIALFPLDDRAELSPADRDDALNLSGVPQHVIYMEA